MERKQSQFSTPQVVGSLSELGEDTVPLAGCDLLELRLDLLKKGEEIPLPLLQSQKAILLTARDPAEGGTGALNFSQRVSLLQKYQPHARYVDFEIANWDAYTELRGEFQSSGVKTIASYHDFSGTPEYALLEEKLHTSQSAGADITKFAFVTHQLSDLATGERLLKEYSQFDISIMGMGPLGALSRLFFAQAGSVLNYGYLGSKPTAPGQWPAPLLKEALACTLRSA